MFVDESFLRLFRDSQGNRYGYFSYGAFGLPARFCPQFQLATEPLFDRYRSLLSGSEAEFKHSSFKRIAYDQRLSLASALTKQTERHDGFMSGSYFPGEAIAMEQVRTLLMDDHHELPEDTSALYAEAARAYRAMYAGGPGDSKLLAQFLTLTISAMVHMLGSFGSPFRIIYDARERRQDRAVLWLAPVDLPFHLGLCRLHSHNSPHSRS